jgi:protein gp37
VRLHPERLDVPLRWKRPRVIFVNSLSDLFHEEIPYEFIERVFETMGAADQHIFQVLTKRPKRMLEFLERYYDSDTGSADPWPNVWLGVTIENARATWRADYLRAANAVVRFISAEPLLGSLFEGDGDTWPESEITDSDGTAKRVDTGWPPLENKRPLNLEGIDWIITGGESGGRHVRPMKPEWAREILEATRCRYCAGRGWRTEYVGSRFLGAEMQAHPVEKRCWSCQGSGRRTASFFKQWGSYAPDESGVMRYVGVSGKSGGKLLDGVEWCEMPGGGQRKLAA